MPKKVFDGLELEIDEDGFLQETEKWNEAVAEFLARGETSESPMGPDHWKVIRYIRDYYLKFEVAPSVRMVCKKTGVNFVDIWNMFPNGPALGACKVAGLPNPTGCFPVFPRIEDFVELAKGGEQVQVKIDLRLQLVDDADSSEETKDAKAGSKNYLLLADYIFKVGDCSHQITKVYASALTQGLTRSMKMKQSIADARLRMDYERLAASGIAFDEKYFRHS